MGTLHGALKTAAKRAGLSVEEYAARVAAGLKRCFACWSWKPRADFSADATRGDGIAARCRSCHSERYRASYVPVPPNQTRYGPPPDAPRDGDKKQARHRVNVLVRSGRLANPNALACTDCGHLGDDRRHEYDHYLGYGAAHHLDVQPVCTICHSHRDNPKWKRTHCMRGHEFTPANTIRSKNGTRHCRECRRSHDRGRRDAAFWREYRAKRKRRQFPAEVPNA